MSCSARPFRFGIVTVTVALLIGGGLVGVGISCASPVSATGGGHPTTPVTTECAGASECHIEPHAVVPPSAVFPLSSCRIQPDSDRISPGPFGLGGRQESAVPRRGSHSAISSPVFETVPSAVSLHLLYSVFLN